MKKKMMFSLLALTASFFGVLPVLLAGSVATQSASYEIQAINEVSLSAASITLTISEATAGSEPTDATGSSSYDITTNCATDGKILTAKLDSAMPSNTELKATFAAPTGGVSAGEVILTASAQNVVTAIDAVAESDLSIAYTLTGTVAAGIVAADTKTLTLTLTDS